MNQALVFKNYEKTNQKIPWWIHLPIFKTYYSEDVSDQGIYKMKYKTAGGAVYVIECGWVKL